jgi:hypothetical protein
MIKFSFIFTKNMKVIRMTVTDLTLTTKSLPMGIIRRMQITY